MKVAVPRTDTFDCIKQRLCAKQSYDPKKVQFKFDGQVVDLKQTPEDLELSEDVRAVFLARDSSHHCCRRSSM